MFTFRRAQQSDQAAIRCLIRAVRINPLQLDWRHFLLAVDAGDALIGCGQIKPHGAGLRELASIAVSPDWRGQGVASALIRQLMQDQPPPLYLTCRESMEPFYRPFGFISLPPEQMPPYYRRIWRAFTWLGPLLGRKEGLRVMRWDG